MAYLKTDSTGQLLPQTDTLQLLNKIPYERRLKLKQKETDEWLKQQERRKRRGQSYDSTMPTPALKLRIDAPNAIAPDENVVFRFEEPLLHIDTTKIHLYSKIDTAWYRSPFRLLPYSKNNQRAILRHQLGQLTETGDGGLDYVLIGQWRPGVEYSIEADSGAFTGLYGELSEPQKTGVRVGSDDLYSTILMTIGGYEGQHLVVDLLNSAGNPVKTVLTDNAQANFYYVKPGTYYARMVLDVNGNGKWDTGNYALHQQPEDVFYYPKKLVLKKNWDVEQTWDVYQLAVDKQKPEEIKKNKPKDRKNDTKRKKSDDDEDEDEEGVNWGVSGFERDNNSYSGNRYNDARNQLQQLNPTRR